MQYLIWSCMICLLTFLDYTRLQKPDTFLKGICSELQWMQSTGMCSADEDKIFYSFSRVDIRWEQGLLYLLQMLQVAYSVLPPLPAHEFTNPCLLITVGITWNFICFCSKCIKSYSGAEAVEMMLMLLLLHILKSFLVMCLRLKT